MTASVLCALTKCTMYVIIILDFVIHNRVSIILLLQWELLLLCKHQVVCRVVSMNTCNGMLVVDLVCVVGSSWSVVSHFRGMLSTELPLYSNMITYYATHS